jgi:hypothetical protein
MERERECVTKVLGLLSSLIELGCGRTGKVAQILSHTNERPLTRVTCLVIPSTGASIGYASSAGSIREAATIVVTSNGQLCNFRFLLSETTLKAKVFSSNTENVQIRVR